MNSLILRTATRLLVAVLLLFSFFLLLRGHNEPGGGFVGGLVAVGAFALYGLAYDETTARQALRFDTRSYIAVGLLIAALSVTGPLLLGRPLMTGLWTELHLTDTLVLEIGTPTIFDIGVYLVVFGIGLTIILGMAEE